MSSLNSSPKKYKEIRARQIRFLGEQDGDPERLLKDELASFFCCDGTIDKAYLARVDFGDGSDVGVVLGLRTRSVADEALVAKVASIFECIFNGKEHLDIMFLTDGQEAQLTRTCRPFFEQSKGESPL